MKIEIAEFFSLPVQNYNINSIISDALPPSSPHSLYLLLAIYHRRFLVEKHVTSCAYVQQRRRRPPRQQPPSTRKRRYRSFYYHNTILKSSAFFECVARVLFPYYIHRLLVILTIRRRGDGVEPIGRTATDYRRAYSPLTIVWKQE